MRRTGRGLCLLSLALTLTACGGDAVRGQAQTFASAHELADAVRANLVSKPTANYTFEMDIGGEKTTATGTGRFFAGSRAISMTMDVRGRPVEMRFVDGTLYVRQPDGKTWSVATPDEVDPATQLLGMQLQEMIDQADLSYALGQIEAAGVIWSLDPMRPDAGSTMRYLIDLDIEELIAWEQPEGLPEEVANRIADRVDTVPMELWLGPDRFPVKVTLDMSEVVEASGSGGEGATFTTTYSDWGAPDVIGAPHPDHVSEN
ncbi:hypothetical protein [Amycolatopsis aidingensis]|uniref:hypothetical protein n=1 Tax=Amycolatopsis aidingensis TaxID=2842453 RepID=UPI001C0E8AB5|nr:hypothetical protein [Amycolatopsis aidingensis]